MLEQFITPINYPELIKAQAESNVKNINHREINGLGAKEKQMIKNSYAKAIIKKYPSRYITHRQK